MRDVLDPVANPVLHVRGEQRGHRAGGREASGRLQSVHLRLEARRPFCVQ